MDRDALISALRRPDPVLHDSSSALTDGAEFEVREGAQTLADLLTIPSRPAP